MTGFGFHNRHGRDALKFAICNEMFEGWDFGRVCEAVAKIGYTGIEIAPFTLDLLVTNISAEQRRTCRKQAEDAGLAVVGLHWLLAKTEGFHINSPDESVRQKTAEYLAELTRCCSDMGGELMVFGSPNARKIAPGLSLHQAMEYAADTIRRFAPTLAERNVQFCIEPLAPTETDFLQTADQGAALMKMVDHPNVVLHLDVKAMSSESKPIPEIIREHAAHTGHFHANDANLRGPGMGDIDFGPIFDALKETGYDKWVSVEVFDFTPGAENIARESLEYMKRFVS